MKIHKLVALNTEVYIASMKWIIPVIDIIFISYISLDQIRINGQGNGLTANAWDMMFLIFGNIYFVSIFIMLPFVFIVGDLTASSNFESYVVLKAGSRRQWWLGKVATVALATLGYVILVLGGVTIITSAIFQWEDRWSSLTVALLPDGSVTRAMLMHSPLIYMAIIVLMLFLGLLALGILTQVASLIFRSTGKGFLLTTFVILAGLVAHGYNFQPPLLDLFIVRHFLPFNYIDDLSAIVFGSLLYWASFIIVLLPTGLARVRGLDCGSV